MGARRDNHNESWFFKRKNQYIFSLAHAGWDNPEPVKYLIKNRELQLELTALLRDELTSLKFLLDYWGMARSLKLRSPLQANEAWGWKDPRNSYTLPIWLDIFPNAKVIHVYRNGIDVASSLMQREQRRRNKLHNPLLSCRCMELNSAFALWAEYVTTCLAVIDSLPDKLTMQIKYEDFLEEPGIYVKKIARVLEIQLDEMIVAKAISEVQPKRAYAFWSDPALEQLYENEHSHPLMERLGYNKLTPTSRY